jgi:hypothetical protein
MICFYAGQPSTHLDLPKGNSRFRDDAFDLRRASDNPLIENPANKKDYAISNRCVGFNVDAGNRNQNIFYSIEIGMDSGKATSESIQTQLNMIDQANGKNTATQNVSLYNLYKQRSYQCTVRCLGNALLQPTMYFNLRHVPMFNGPYFITQVDHVITAGNFQTSFTGVRQGIYDLPSINNFLQSINQNLLTKIESLVKNSKDDVTAKAITNVDKSKYISQAGGSTAAAQNSCRNNLAVPYQSFGDVQSSTTMSITLDDFVKELEKKTSNPDLQVLIYMICYAKTFDQTKFYGYANNYANVTLTTDYGPTGNGYFSGKKYSCVNIPNSTGTKTSQPIANFNTIGDFFDFMIARLLPRVNQVFVDGMGITKYYVCHWPVSNVSESYYDSNISEFKTLEETFDKAFKSAGDAGLNVEATTKLKVATTNQKKKNNNTLAGVTTPANNLNTTTNVVPSCPPPTITSFSPLTGVSGTILTIVGNNLDEVTGITINNVTTTTGITILNAFNISVVVPYSNTIFVETNPVILKGIHGNSITFLLSEFTYNPNQQTPTTPSQIPGAPPNVNTQPQQTGPLPLSGTTTYNTNGGDSTLTVTINPAAGNWIMVDNSIRWSWKIDKRVLGANNAVENITLETETDNRDLEGYLSNDKKTFYITDDLLLAELKNSSALSDDEINNASVIYSKIQFVAVSPDKYVKYNTTNNLDDVIPDAFQSFQFILKFI